MARGLLFLVLIVVVGALSAVFADQNRGLIELKFLAWDFEILKSLAFTLTLAIGWLLGLLSASLYILKSMAERRKLRKSIRMAEVELKNLRSLPMQDAG